jgi:hypothetical protein
MSLHMNGNGYDANDPVINWGNGRNTRYRDLVIAVHTRARERRYL